ncbi:hypothetical protein B0T14DRAFT_521718 [Immersiella caudata]|uniref:Uncharacterized protein n=1 Tax=Immersiella caudata TaxID=314043 RepID=A0AA39WS37_9PEZI|nr:hypothetical protein B0T14DRAFT_521718 [Immersiella caudata]
MLASSSQITMRAGCLHPSSLRSIGISGDALRRQHQIRGFRFGRGWGSYFESEPQHDDIYRRYRSFRYKYTEALSRRHDGQSFAEDAKSALRRIVDEHQHARGGKPRWVGKCRSWKAESTPNNPEGVRPGQNIEDVERAPIEHLLFGDRPRMAQNYYDNWDSPLSKYEHSRRSHRTKQPKSDLSKVTDTTTTAEAGPEYIIDPITNRKVAKGSLASPSILEKGLEPPVKNFKSYRSQFSSFRPPAATASKPPAPPTIFAGEPIPKLPSTERQPILESERYVAELNDAPASSLLDTLSEKQQSVFWHHSDVIAPPPSKQASWTLEPDVEAYLSPGRSKSLVGQDVTAQYGDLHKYEAVRYLEPNGKTSEQETVSTYDDLGEYDAFRSHEPDGKYKLEMPSVDPEELKLYKPFRSCEPDGKYAESYREEKLDPSELAQYSQPFMSHEPDGKYAESYGNPGTEDAELPEYEPFSSHEPDGKYANKSGGTTVSAKELEGYAAAPAHELDGKSEGETSPKLDPEEPGKYKASRSHEPDGKYAVEAEPVEETDLGGNHEAFGYDDAEVASSVKDTQPKVEPSELSKYTAVRYNEPDGKPAVEESSSEPVFDYDLKASGKKDGTPDRTHYRKMLETFMAQSASVSDAIDADTSSSLKEKRAAAETGKPTLSGNYAQDFPEEFVKSWSADTYTSSASAPEQAVEEPTSALEPALDRYNGKTENKSADNEAAGVPPVPTLYKVLVYDPTMQCIDVAETTSIVKDSNTPLTPAEVLLRISNPAKFLPHFGPLQAQGFEVVSGAGDVLIFRKVREAIPEVSHSGTVGNMTAETAAPPSPNRPAINPIDMMGGPRDYTVAASRFASPTGFVNYDLPPRFDSNIDVRREEPVFSGAKEKSSSEGKKTSLPKRIAVGALWVGAASYSIGIVGEYFKTGGADGKGPKGL